MDLVRISPTSVPLALSGVGAPSPFSRKRPLSRQNESSARSSFTPIMLSATLVLDCWCSLWSPEGVMYQRVHVGVPVRPIAAPRIALTRWLLDRLHRSWVAFWGNSYVWSLFNLQLGDGTTTLRRQTLHTSLAKDCQRWANLL